MKDAINARGAAGGFDAYNRFYADGRLLETRKMGDMWHSGYATPNGGFFSVGSGPSKAQAQERGLPYVRNPAAWYASRAGQRAADAQFTKEFKSDVVQAIYGDNNMTAEEKAAAAQDVLSNGNPFGGQAVTVTAGDPSGDGPPAADPGAAAAVAQRAMAVMQTTRPSVGADAAPSASGVMETGSPYGPSGPMGGGQDTSGLPSRYLGTGDPSDAYGEMAKYEPQDNATVQLLSQSLRALARAFGATPADAGVADGTDYAHRMTGQATPYDRTDRAAGDLAYAQSLATMQGLERIPGRYYPFRWDHIRDTESRLANARSGAPGSPGYGPRPYTEPWLGPTSYGPEDEDISAIGRPYFANRTVFPGGHSFSH